MVVAS
jgi:hypothetical protein